MRNAFSGSLGIRIAGAGFALTQTLLLARLLGPSDLGSYSALLAIGTLLGLPVAAGIPTLLTREIARAKVMGEPERIAPLISAGHRIALVATVVAWLALLVLAFTDLLPTVSLLQFVLLGLLIPLLGIDLIRAGAMRGLHSAIRSQIPENIVRPLMLLLSIVVLWALTGQLTVELALLAFCVACLLSYLVGTVMLLKILPQTKTQVRIGMRALIPATTGLALLAGSQTLLGNLDVLLLARLGTLSDVGVYKVALVGSVLLLLIHNATSAVTLRDMATRIAQGDKESIIEASDRSTRYSFLGTLGVLLIFLAGGGLAIELLFGNHYAEAFPVLVILGVGHVLNTATGPTLEILMMVEGHRRALVANAFGLAILIVVAMIASYWSPLIGVALAASCSTVVRNAAMALAVYRVLTFDPSMLGVIGRARSRRQR